MRKNLYRKGKRQSLASVIAENSAKILAKNGGILGILELKKELSGLLKNIKLRGDYILSSLFHSRDVEIQGKNAVLIGRCIRQTAPTMAARKQSIKPSSKKIPEEIINFYKTGKLK